MRDVARQQRCEEADQERRIGRPAIEVDAGQVRVQSREHWRVPAERVDQHCGERHRQRSDLAPPQCGGEQSDQQQQQRDRAEVEHAHVLRDEQVRAAPRVARRAPVVGHRPGGAEHVRRQRRHQQRGMQRAAPGADQIDVRPVRLLGDQRRHGDRKRDQQRPGDGPGGQRPETAAQASPRATIAGGRGIARCQRAAEHDLPNHQHDQQIDRQQRDLVAPEHHERGDRAGGDPVPRRAARHSPAEQHQHDRQICETDHLPGVLDAPGHRGSEREGDRRDQPAGPMPAAITEPDHHRQRAEQNGDEHGRIDGPEARVAIDECQRQKRRREDQRLRVGDLRVA